MVTSPLSLTLPIGLVGVLQEPFGGVWSRRVPEAMGAPFSTASPDLRTFKPLQRLTQPTCNSRAAAVHQGRRAVPAHTDLCCNSCAVSAACTHSSTRAEGHSSAHTPLHTNTHMHSSQSTHTQIHTCTPYTPLHTYTHSSHTVLHTHTHSSHTHTCAAQLTHTPLHRPHTHMHACPTPHASPQPGLASKPRVQGGHSSHLVPALLSWGPAAFTGVTDRLGGDLSPQRGPGYIPKRRACLCLLCPVSFLHCGHILSDLHPTRAPSPGGGLRCRSTRQLFLWVSQAWLPLGPPQSTGPYTS